MKNISTLFTAFALLLGAAFTAQANEVPTQVEAAGEGQKLVHISTLNSVEANQEFQRNVRVIQAQRQALIDLLNQINETIDIATKEDLEAQRDALLERLNANNQTMLETYGFSLNRNYVMVMEKSHIFLVVSEEEAKAIEEQLLEAGAVSE